MRISGRTRFAFVWLAALAMLMATLAPSISQAIAASGGGDWSNICSANDVGGDSLDAAPRGRPGEPAHTHTFEHCPYCALHADAAPPPAGQALAMNADAAFMERPAAFLDAPRGTWIWSTAQPRAPPAAA